MVLEGVAWRQVQAGKLKTAAKVSRESHMHDWGEGVGESGGEARGKGRLRSTQEAKSRARGQGGGPGVGGSQVELWTNALDGGCWQPLERNDWPAGGPGLAGSDYSDVTHWHTELLAGHRLTQPGWRR